MGASRVLGQAEQPCTGPEGTVALGAAEEKACGQRAPPAPGPVACRPLLLPREQSQGRS